MARHSHRLLLERFVRDGDDAAMEAFVRATRRKLVGVAARIGARQDAEDTVQAAYHALLRRGDDLPDEPFAWLVTTVVRIAYRRKAAARRDAALAARLGRPAENAAPPAEAAREEERRLVRREVARLPARFRDAVVLHHLEGLSVAEAARLLDVPAATVKTRLHRGRALLRGRLAPLLAYAVLLVPWLCADAARAAAHALPTLLGGTMKAKTTGMVLGIALATGAVGVGVGVLWRDDQRAPAPRAASDDGRAGTLVAELDAERERARTLERRLDEARHAPRVEEADRPAATETEAEAKAKAKAEHTDAPVSPAADPEVPRTAAQVAAHMGIDPEAMRAAVVAREGCEALWRPKRRDADEAADYERALAGLKLHGEQGYLAVLALMRGGDHGVWFDRLLTDAYRPGCERHVFDALEEGDLPRYGRHSAIVGLGAADTPEVHRFLNTLAADTKDPGEFYAAARALSRLRDDASARLVEERLGTPGYGGIEGHLLGTLGVMDGPDARAVLVRYLESPRAKPKFLGTAAHALARTDSAAAAAHAQRILQGPRADELDGRTLRGLERIARRE